MISRKPKPCIREGCDRTAFFGKVCDHCKMRQRQQHGRTHRATLQRGPHFYAPLSAKVTPAQRDALYEKQQGLCPHCARWMPREGAHIHHRKQVSVGGTNDPANLMLVPGWCHTDIHEHEKDRRSQALGHIVMSWDDPALIEVLPVSAWRVA